MPNQSSLQQLHESIKSGTAAFEFIRRKMPFMLPHCIFCTVKPKKKLMSTWQVELNNVESKLRDLVLYEFVEKLHIKHLTVYLKNV